MVEKKVTNLCSLHCVVLWSWFGQGKAAEYGGKSTSDYSNPSESTRSVVSRRQLLHNNHIMAQKKGCVHSAARTKTIASNKSSNAPTLRWKKAEDLIKELEQLNFNDAAQAVRKQLARERKQAAVKTNSQSKSRQSQSKVQKKTKDDESVTDESSSSSVADDDASESSEESSASSEEESSSSEEEEEEEEDSSSEEKEESSSEEDDAEESEDEEETPQKHKTTQAPTKKPVRAPYRRVVSFSEKANNVHVLSPKLETKDKLYYTRHDIERFRMEERMRRTEEAQTNLEALIAEAKITMMGSAC
jgi:cobalamin biosynthesis protein CobT